MNAIGGVFYKKRTLSAEDNEQIKNMMQKLGKYEHESFGEFKGENIYFGCFKTSVTPHSAREKLPYKDSSKLVIVADAIIDNRAELCQALMLKDSLDLSDSEIILLSYKKWGIECPKRLVGDFTFAIWNNIDKSLFVARDHVGKRVLYIYEDAHKFVFSTLINPMFAIEGVLKEPCEQYIADFLGYPAITSQLVPDLTIYNDIYQLCPAQACAVNPQVTEKWMYWKVEKTELITFKTREACEEAFMDVYSEAVRCRLRSTGEIGLYLSGGLDSTSVGALASRELKPLGRNVLGFTQVPINSYIEVLTKNKIADERDYVESLCNMWDNIIPHYIDSEGLNPLNLINTMLDILEHPYKTLENAHWAYQILKEAKSRGVKTILDGQSGNGTVSWGSYSLYLNGLLHELRLGEFLKESKRYSRLKNTSFLKTIRRTIYHLSPYSIKKFKYKGENYIDTLSAINKDFYKKFAMDKRFKELGADPLFLPIGTSFAHRFKLLEPSIYAQLGAFETKASLASGVCRRDPTRDKRLIEFCINLDEKYWIGEDGMERYLIRSSTKGFLPDKIRLNTSERGMQAADWAQRIEPIWKNYHDEIKSIGSHPLESKYLDTGGIRSRLEANTSIKVDAVFPADIRYLIRSLIFSRFIRENFNEGI